MRTPAVAGAFYPAEKEKLERMVSGFLKKASEEYKPVSAVGGVCPHAGYVYSGQTAAITFVSIAGLEKAETIVLLGPNHTGRGSLISLSLMDWETPVGVLKCDVELAKKIQKNSTLIDFDENAHMFEHSIEVQLPFIRSINPDAKIVCICMMAQDYGSALDVGNALAKSLNPEKHIVIASSDFSHYLPAEEAGKKDSAARSFIEALDGKGFEDALEKHGWSVCGYGPITALMEYAKAKGIKRAKTLRYADSGRATGDYSAVVGYGSMIFPREK
ncbi:MAG: AmmeMemoRadiSam system protein B [Candidatus ainarchaeum sp.]|nr:AmmeMemoRadiSam system protein B [Candidatus ainarchaeum sp.]